MQVAIQIEQYGTFSCTSNQLSLNSTTILTSYKWLWNQKKVKIYKLAEAEHQIISSLQWERLIQFCCSPVGSTWCSHCMGQYRRGYLLLQQKSTMCRVQPQTLDWHQSTCWILISAHHATQTEPLAAVSLNQAAKTRVEHLANIICMQQRCINA